MNKMYENFLKRVEDSLKLESEINSIYLEYEELNQKLNDYKSIYKLFDSDFIFKLNKLILDYNESKSKIMELKKRISCYPSVASLDIKSLNLEKVELMNQIMVLSNSMPSLKVTEEDILNLEEKYNSLLNEYENINLAIRFLENAKNKILNEYLDPINQDFLNIINMLNPSLSDLKLDSNYNLNLYKDLKVKNYKHLSSGELTIAMISYKIAILKRIYKDEKIFLILDDPFVYLDDLNMKQMKDFILKLSLKFQIIYLCPHLSRMIS